METLFTSTTVLLTREYVNLYSPDKLASKLSKVRLATGVQYRKAKNTYALVGSWEQVNEAFELLQFWQQQPDAEPTVETNVCQDSDASAADKDHLRQSDTNYERTYDNDEAPTDYFEDNYHGTIQEDVNNLSKEVKNQKKRNQKCLGIQKKGGKHLTQDSNNTDVHYKSRSTRNKICKDKQGPIGKNLHNKEILEKSRQNKSDLDKTKYVDLEHDGNNIRSGNEKTLQKIERAQVSKDVIQRVLLNSKTVTSTVTSNSDKENVIKSDSEDRNQINLNVNNNNITKHTGHVNESQSVKQNKKSMQKKPGDAGYWSRLKIKDYNEKHMCEICSVSLKSRKRYLEHVRRIHIKNFQCDVCKRGFGYPTDLNRHKCAGVVDPENKHKAKGGRPKREKVIKQVLLPCSQCEFISTSKTFLNSHVKRMHSLSLSCGQCDRRFGFERDLRRHVENVHTTTSFFCDRCSRFYKSQSVFEAHLKTHEVDYVKPMYMCHVCSKSFTTKYVLTAHIKTEHLGLKKTYLCQVCGKKFSQRNSYRQHSNAHNGIKPYVCNICGKAFTYHKSLKEHKFMHDNVRRFQCTLCDKAFRQRTTLQIHMKVHKTIKDHICKTCGKGFSQKQALERHDRIHSGLKPYKCIPCQRHFGDASTVRRHMIAIHNKTDLNWREDIICKVKRKTDYYVTGGSGQNRVYKCKTNQFHSDNSEGEQDYEYSNDTLKPDSKHVEPELSHVPYDIESAYPMQEPNHPNTANQIQQINTQNSKFTNPQLVNLVNLSLSNSNINLQMDTSANVNVHNQISLVQDNQSQNDIQPLQMTYQATPIGQLQDVAISDSQRSVQMNEVLQGQYVEGANNPAMTILSFVGYQSYYNAATTNNMNGHYQQTTPQNQQL